MLRLSIVALSAALLAGCVSLAPEEPAQGSADTDSSAVSMQTHWLGASPQEGIPEGVTSIQVYVQEAGREEQVSGFTVANLMDTNGNGRVEAVRKELPFNVELRVRVEGKSGEEVTHVGHVEPFTLSVGERRHIQLTMLPVGSNELVEGSPMSPRILHTQTELDDGRVLIAGGFDSVSPTECPSGLPADATCYALQAAADAYFFHPSRGDITPVSEQMFSARGGHSATKLSDGRVLIAGGAEQALLIFAPRTRDVPDPDDPTMTVERSHFTMDVRPMSPSGDVHAWATFEVFDPERPLTEAEDSARDGDPFRGGFWGATRERVGLLNNERFLHAAAVDPTNGLRVVLAGGRGRDRADRTFELWDANRPGGSGVVANEGWTLRTSRPMPSAISRSDGVFIVGGGFARNNGELMEVWDPSGGSATVAGGSYVGSMDSPELNFLRPSLAKFGRADDQNDAFLAVGWYGVGCDGDSPAFGLASDALDANLCTSAETSTRAALINEPRTPVLPTTSSGRAFASATTLSDGRVLVSGGLDDSQDARISDSLDVFAADGSGSKVELPSSLSSLRDFRVFHATSSFPNNGVLTTGGITWTDDLQEVSLVSEVEFMLLR